MDASKLEFDFTTNLFKTVAVCGVLYFLIFQNPIDFSKIRLSYGDSPRREYRSGSSEAMAAFGPSSPKRGRSVTLTNSELEKDAARRAYIDRYANVAVGEKNKFGIPASITLAQGILESDAGQSKLATATNNHFGVKCFSRRCAAGHCLNFKDDTHKDFFVKYPSVWASYRAHSQLLKSSGRYARLFDLDQTDAEGWARGLDRLGYATSPTYADNLLRIIALYDLTRFDQ